MYDIGSIFIYQNEYSNISHRRIEYISIYLSIDIDFFDPSFAPGTDFPEICGASLNDFIEIWDSLRELRNQIIGIDIVEINPNKDTMDMTFQLSTIIITKILNSLMP